mmetsp:Transcript_43313/g.106978  ORF Transcript_43313/g.106978 Transcript_43313/m.106978 type:complete len:336 (-) Transcript_43313:464-1471(-)
MGAAKPARHTRRRICSNGVSSYPGGIRRHLLLAHCDSVRLLVHFLQGADDRLFDAALRGIDGAPATDAYHRPRWEGRAGVSDGMAAVARGRVPHRLGNGTRHTARQAGRAGRGCAREHLAHNLRGQRAERITGRSPYEAGAVSGAGAGLHGGRRLRALRDGSAERQRRQGGPEQGPLPPAAALRRLDVCVGSGVGGSGAAFETGLPPLRRGQGGATGGSACSCERVRFDSARALVRLLPSRPLRARTRRRIHARPQQTVASGGGRSHESARPLAILGSADVRGAPHACAKRGVRPELSARCSGRGRATCHGQHRAATPRRKRRGADERASGGRVD